MQTQQTVRELAEQVNAHMDGWSQDKYLKHQRVALRWMGAVDMLFWIDQFRGPQDDRVEAERVMREVGARILAL